MARILYKMIIGLAKEDNDKEYRVALIPSTVKKFCMDGHEVLLLKGSGEKAGYSDDEYVESGAKIVSFEDLFKLSKIIVKINAFSKKELLLLDRNQWVVANFDSYRNEDNLKNIKKNKVNAIALERLPRLSRVQDIDILSSQDNLSGYKAALVALNMQNKAASLMMTSAGTIYPLKAMVIGIGVTGLQAIATLQRMGCIVWGVDIRKDVEEQVVSLGAKFILSSSKNFLEEIKEAQIIITSANSITSHPPKIIHNSMLRELSHGTIIVDTSGGNVEDIKAESLVEFGNIKIVSSQYFASDIAYSASQLFSNNLYNFISRLDEIKKDEEVWSKISINELI